MSSNAGGLILWPAKGLVFAGFAILCAQAVSEIIKRVLVLSGRTTDESPEHELPPIIEDMEDRGNAAPRAAPGRRARTMIDLIAHNLAPIMFVSVMAMLLLGYPVAFTLASGGLLFFVIGVEVAHIAPEQINLFWPLLQANPERVFGVMSSETLLAIPFFTFMGIILERSRMAEDLLDTIGQLFGPIRGGLAFAAVVVGALLAATTGVVAASVIAMGLISLPIMMRYGYDNRVATGTIAAAGSLAQVIPPSLVLIVMADQLGRSVGDMYVGAIIPGLMLVALYCLYVFVITMVRPKAVPALPVEARTLGGGIVSLIAILAVSAAIYVAAYYFRVRPDALRDPGGLGGDADDPRRLRLQPGKSPFQVRSAVAACRAGGDRADPAARSHLPRAGHDLPGNRHADRRRRHGRNRRAGARFRRSVGSIWKL